MMNLAQRRLKVSIPRQARLRRLWQQVLSVLKIPFEPGLRWVTGLAITATGVYATVSILRFSRFQSAGYDLGIFDQVVRQYSAFLTPYSSIKGINFNIFGDHFHPIIATLAPLYWIWNDPRMLGIALALLIASSVYPVYLFCRTRLGHWAAFVVTTGYVFWWPIQGIVDFDFHEIAFGVPLIAWIIFSLDRRAYVAVSILSLALLCVREDTGFIVMATALILLLHRKWKLSIMLFLMGMTTYLVVTGVVIPHFNVDGSFGYWVYSALGATMGAAIFFIVSNPLKVLGLLVDHDTKQFLLGALLVPLALLPLGSVYIILTLPIILSRLLSDRPGTWTTGYQYNAILAPILVMAAVDFLFRFTNRFPKLKPTRTWAPALFVATVVGGIAFIPAVFPLHKLVTGESFAYTTHMAAQQQIVNMIPSGVCVEADDRLVPHLTNRTTTSLIGRLEGYASWAIIDFDQDNSGGGGDGNFTPNTALDHELEEGFIEVYRKDNIVLLHRDRSENQGSSSFCSSQYQFRPL